MADDTLVVIAYQYDSEADAVADFDDLHARLLLAQGNPGAEILRVIAEQSTDLLVLGWQGRWAAKHAATLKAVVREAPCPTMVVRV